MSDRPAVVSEGSDIQGFVNDPGLLVEICREVIDRLDVSTDDMDAAERQAQLREISKTIERMEKAGVSVPEVLRGEKTRLVASLSLHADASEALGLLAEEFENILKDLRDRLRTSPSAAFPKPRGKRSRLPKTSRTELRGHIICALKKLGGSARVSDVIEEMGRQLEGKLQTGDTEWREAANEYVWQNNAKWERYQMTQDGTLRSDSSHGFWELNEGSR